MAGDAVRAETTGSAVTRRSKVDATRVPLASVTVTSMVRSPGADGAQRTWERFTDEQPEGSWVHAKL